MSAIGQAQFGREEADATSVAASVRAADILRARILGGELPAGTALRESALATSLDISRNTLREALRQLLNEGLIEQALYRGATVRRMSHADARDIFTVRRTLQFRAVELSAYASQQHLDDLDRWVSYGESAAVAGLEMQTTEQLHRPRGHDVLPAPHLQQFDRACRLVARHQIVELGPPRLRDRLWPHVVHFARLSMSRHSPFTSVAATRSRARLRSLHNNTGPASSSS